MTSKQLKAVLTRLEAARSQGLELRSRSGLKVAEINVIHGTFWTRSECGVHYNITASLLIEWIDALNEWQGKPEELERLSVIEARLTKLETLIDRKLKESAEAGVVDRLEKIENLISNKRRKQLLNKLIEAGFDVSIP